MIPLSQRLIKKRYILCVTFNFKKYFHWHSIIRDQNSRENVAVRNNVQYSYRSTDQTIYIHVWNKRKTREQFTDCSRLWLLKWNSSFCSIPTKQNRQILIWNIVSISWESSKLIIIWYVNFIKLFNRTRSPNFSYSTKPK